MRMLHSDLLERRALALLTLIDVFGRPVLGQVHLSGPGLRIVAKGSGRHAVISAAGFSDYESAFAAPPATPAIGSKSFRIDLRPADSGLAPRSVTIKLPRDPDPAKAATAGSLFAPVPVVLLPAPQCPVPASAAALRVTVRKKNDGRRVAGALVRVSSAGGTFKARAVTDAAGEALVIVPHFPLSHTGPGGQIDSALDAKATVVADPDAVRLIADGAVAAERRAALAASGGFLDPDALEQALPAPGGGTNCKLSTRMIATLNLEWKNP